MRRPLGVLLGTLLCGACAPTPPEPQEEPAALEQSIVQGTEAPEDVAVVALIARRARCADESLTLLCTGALIAPDVVLTAAHCLSVFGEEGQYEVFFGTRLLPAPEPSGRFVRVSRAVRHPGYEPETHAWDAALLRLAEPVDVVPLPLPRRGWGALESGQPARVVGYGDTREASRPEGLRRQGTLSVTEVAPGAFRAGPAPAMSCVGDSGGPVLVPGAEGREVLVGITASGDVACRTEAFNVRVEALLADFIEPFLAQVPVSVGPVLAPESLCRATCTRDAECPEGLACVANEAGAPGRCLQYALQEGAYTQTCTEDAQCGAGSQCARLGSEGPEACRCFTPCGQVPGDVEEEPGGCAGAPGPSLWAWSLLAWGLLSRRGGSSASWGRRAG
jgi:hypothetical protein